MTIKIYHGLKLDVRGFKTRSKMLTSLWFTTRLRKKTTLSGCWMSIFLPM